MANDIAKELQAARAKVAALESSLAKSRRQTLAGLHKEHGFDNVEEFLSAVREASRGGGGGRRGRPAKAGKVSASGASSGQKRAKRTRITPEIKQKVKSLVQDGQTGARIASELGISLPSVQNIKRELGLVKARG
jgi:DNA-binding NarL/FixJ family response regulator